MNDECRGKSPPFRRLRAPDGLSFDPENAESSCRLVMDRSSGKQRGGDRWQVRERREAHAQRTADGGGVFVVFVFVSFSFLSELPSK